MHTLIICGFQPAWLNFRSLLLYQKLWKFSYRKSKLSVWFGIYNLVVQLMYCLKSAVRLELSIGSMNVSICSHALLRIYVIGGQRSARIAPPLPASSSQWFSNQGLSFHHLGWSTPLRVSFACAGPPSPIAPVLCHGPVLWSPPSGSDSDSPTHAPLQLTSPSSPSHRHLGAPSV